MHFKRKGLQLKSIALVLLLVGTLTSAFAEQGYPNEDIAEYVEPTSQRTPSANLLKVNSSITISVVGEGVAPSFTISPAQAYALAKRAAIADAYRLIAEKVKGVEVEGKDTVRNMVIKRSTVSTHVQAMIRNANIVETTFKEGLCEVEMEVRLSYYQFN